MKSLVALILALSPLILTSENSMLNNGRGVYVDFVESFKPGEQVIRYNKKINNVLGRPKSSLREALSLGHYGEVVVSYTKGIKKKNSATCFMRNNKGPSLLVHEPFNESNRPETVEVFVTSEKILTKKTEWISLGVKNVKGYEKNWIAFDLPKERGFYYHIKLRDAGSKLTTSVPEYAGFEASSVYITNPCSEMV